MRRDPDPTSRGDAGRPDGIRRTPRRVPRPAALAAALEAVGLAAWFVVFTRLHALAGHDVGAANRNAERLQSLERTLHLDIVLEANEWLTEHPSLIAPAVWVYRLYYVVVVAVLVWLFWRHRTRYPRLRRTLVTMTVLVLPVWWALPLSPPRFALPGVVDIIGEHDLFGSRASVTLDNGQNHFSAMPSMHVALAAWCAYAVWSALRERRPQAAWLAWLFPVLMTALVFTTGNHYVLDVVGSAVLLGVAVVLGRLVGQALQSRG